MGIATTYVKKSNSFQKANWLIPAPDFKLREPFFTIEPRTKKAEFEKEQPLSQYGVIEFKPAKISIKLDSKEIIKLPIHFKDLAEKIEESKYMLDFKDNWDDEGSIRYKKETWIRAIKFIINYLKWAKEKADSIIKIPNIAHGPNGSIDIYWNDKNYRMLINIPENPESPFSIYGDDYENNKVKGTLDPAKFNYGMLLCIIATK